MLPFLNINEKYYGQKQLTTGPIHQFNPLLSYLYQSDGKTVYPTYPQCNTFKIVTKPQRMSLDENLMMPVLEERLLVLQ